MSASGSVAQDRTRRRLRGREPYQVNSETMAASGNPDVKFMHSLPAFHNKDTEVGKEIFEKFGLEVAWK